jgi:hypothetical protein
MVPRWSLGVDTSTQSLIESTMLRALVDHVDGGFQVSSDV